MATTLEKLEKRVAYLERELRRNGVLLDDQEERTDTHFSETNQKIDTVGEQVSELARDMREGFAGLEKRHDFTDGQIADVRSDVTEVRNKVADLVRYEDERKNKK